MTTAEIHENDDGTATLYIDGQPYFTGTDEECQDEMFRIFNETMEEINSYIDR